ncbi:MAG TPA: DNA ligase D [Candidatus Saccharimonadales bacterium]|nr:DNA ligase D [Candidatus Saccharimonadales bacterium]
MALTDYKKKRNFGKTREPAGKVQKRQGGNLRFVVQKHHASRLHYDFRLEMEGVLKSWAVPKGPSLNPQDKRLAVMVEDHPLSYRTFEGTIAKGNYGAGEVIVWDEGTYSPVEETDDPEKILLEQLKAGHLDFTMAGKKLKGRFALIRSAKMEKDGWLLIKKRDEQASTADIRLDSSSVRSDRILEVAKETLDITGLKKSSIPKQVKPMLATLVKEAFDDEDWLFEIKWDGYRAVAASDGKESQLYSRNGNDFSKKYPPIFEGIKALKGRFVLDGEIVCVDKDGISHFEWLQNYKSQPQGTLRYMAFDILWKDGRNLETLPLYKRKEILRVLVKDSDIVYYSDHVIGKGQEFFSAASKKRLEGIMAKQKESLYKEATRSKQWLKIKTHRRQEVVIGGFTEPKGQRRHIGALLVGVYDEGKLRYAGHVGGGIPPEQLEQLRKRMEKLAVKVSPFEGKVTPNAAVHWIKPELICEVSFAEWTKQKIMRQPIFVGLREDKQPTDVHREEEEDIGKLKPVAEDEQPHKKTGKDEVNFTHPDKVFFPKVGYTKADLLEYYKNVSGLMLPYLKDRPESLLRHPNGQSGKSFFQKDASTTLPAWAKTVAIDSEAGKKKVHYMVCDELRDLELMVQLGCIEINPWSSTVKSLNKPDWAVIDLDPEGISFKQVVQVALEVKKVCDELDIPSYPKTSGKSGIHIFIPLGAKYTFKQVRVFSELMANLIHERTESLTSLLRSPSKRRHKVYIDYLQNREGQTLAAPYSVRPTDVASVSTPLKWEEVNDSLSPEQFTIKTALERFDKVGDLWAPVLKKGVDIPSVLKGMEDKA